MLEPAVRTADCPLGPDQYRYIATRGWWMGSFGTSTGLLLHLTEQWIRQWVPARPERDWLLDREVTGRVRWLTGSAEEADDEGFDPAAGVPTGRFRAPHGDFYAGLDDLPGVRVPRNATHIRAGVKREATNVAPGSFTSFPPSRRVRLAPRADIRPMVTFMSTRP